MKRTLVALTSGELDQVARGNGSLVIVTPEHEIVIQSGPPRIMTTDLGGFFNAEIGGRVDFNSVTASLDGVLKNVRG